LQKLCKFILPFLAMHPTANIYLDTRTVVKKEGNRNPLKIRITLHNKSNRSWGIGKFFTPKEFDKLLNNKRRDPYKDQWNEIESLLKHSEELIERMMPFFSYDDFKEQFFNNKSFDIISDKTSLIYIRDVIVNRYLKNNNLPMSVKIKDSVASILKFTKTENLPMRSITPEFCQHYEDYMYEKSKTKTRNGAGINMRHVRILFNEGIKMRIIPMEWYPFKRESGERSEFEHPYVIPNEQKIKTFLKEDEFVKFAVTKEFQSVNHELAHAAFLIAFHCNGANAADFLRFKFRDIQGDFIVFYREKIKNASKANRKPIKIYLSKELMSLIKNYGNPPLPENYIFKCYRDEMTEVERYLARMKFNRIANRNLKNIMKDLDITKSISIGKARHSLANILKKNDVNREFVKDILGHTSILTTDNYFDQFEDDKHTSIFDNLISIPKMQERLTQKGPKFSEL
jgi:integrase/recombinase XerD